MSWTKEAHSTLTAKLANLWPSMTENQVQATLGAIQGFPPPSVSDALDRIYARQETPRRPTVPEITGEVRGGPSGITPRIAAYKEMDEIQKRLMVTPKVEIRGNVYDVSPSGLSRLVATSSNPERRSWVGMAMGDLSNEEVRQCLDAMRAADPGDKRP